MKIEIPEDIRTYVRKQRVKRLLLCVVLFVILGVIGYFYINKLYPLNRNLSYIFFSLMILLITGVPHKLIDSTWHGTIVSSKNVTSTEHVPGMPFTYNYFWSAVHKKLAVADENGNVTIRRSEKIREKYSQDITDELVPGNYVVHVGGTKYTLVFTKNPEHFRCAVCGMENPSKNTHCVDCGHTMIRMHI